MDTKIGQQEKADPAEVAQIGYEAMKTGDDAVITGWKNTLQVAMRKYCPRRRPRKRIANRRSPVPAASISSQFASGCPVLNG
jgi:hypothetical protein